MGRKNRNARSRCSYDSFNELKNSTVRFDLSNGTFLSKNRKSNRKACVNEDVGVSINHDSQRDENYIGFSIKEDISEVMIKGYGAFWTCGIVKEGVFERLYLIPDEYGYKLYTNDHGKRFYTKIPIDKQESIFKKYVGHHKMQYDDFNKAYYITADE